MNWLGSLLINASSTDPDDVRRRRLLNIILGGLAIFSIATFILTIIVNSLNKIQGIELILLSSLMLLGASIIIYFINRYLSSQFASVLFLLLFLIILSFSDRPEELVAGRSSYVFFLPIIIAAALLPQVASFLAAIGCTITVLIISSLAGIYPNAPMIAGFYFFALISWLVSRNLEDALRELRLINNELDQRVGNKTDELAKALELVLKRTKELEEALERDRKKTEFLSTVSHELRTPLTPVKGSIENLLSEMYGPLNDKQRARLEMALTNVNDEARLIENLLDLVRIQEERVTLDLDKENIANLVKSVVQVFEYDAKKKHIKLSMDLAAKEDLTAYFDRGKIKQVITNLVGNAIKFTPEKGTVLILVSGNSKWIRVDVKDDGIGIPVGEEEKIFERFYQVDSSLTRKAGGTGIGLSIVKEYVQMHGGKVIVESEVGKGSVFAFTLPRNIVKDDTDES